MSYHIEWANEEQTVIVQVHRGHIKMDDHYCAINETLELVKSVDHAVDVIIDLKEMTSINMNGFISSAQYANMKIPDNKPMVVVVGANLFIQTMGNIARKFAPKATDNLYFVDSRQDAHQIIEEYRQHDSNCD